MRVTVDTSRCDGFGYCEQRAPEVFRLDDEGELSVLATEVGDDLADAVTAAARACPVAALRLTP